jgi:hypothetical protein
MQWLTFAIGETTAARFDALIDTAAAALAGRAFANLFRQRAQRRWLSMPDAHGVSSQPEQHRLLLARADQEAELSRRWGALAHALTTTSR